MAAILGDDHDPLLSVVGDVPMAEIEAAVNEARHYEALAPWLSHEMRVPIPERGSWSATLPQQSGTEDDA
ncbi:MAG: hypothetical protein ACRDRH_26910 [Pseudonocardia sp.]